jgi:hypothetical protein
VVSNTYCAVFLFCFSSSCVLSFASFSGLSILLAPSAFSNVYWDRQKAQRIKQIFGLFYITFFLCHIESFRLTQCSARVQSI